MKKHLLTLAFSLSILSSKAQTALQPGDLFFVAFQLSVTPSSPDRFAFVTLKDLEPNTKILFTDKAILANQTLCTNEDTCLWTSPNATVNAGTVVTITEVVGGTNGAANLGTCQGNMGSLSSSGDQIFALQRSASGLQFITAVSNTSFLAVCASACTGTNSTCLPQQLAGSNYFLTFNISPAIANGFYSGPTTFDSVGAFINSLRNASNWTTTVAGSPQSTWPSPWSFSVGTVSVPEKFKTGSLVIYPNPSTGSFLVKLKNNSKGKIRVMNILGLLVEEKTLEHDQMSFTSLKPGVYMIQHVNEKNQLTSASKLVVK